MKEAYVLDLSFSIGQPSDVAHSEGPNDTHSGDTAQWAPSLSSPLPYPRPLVAPAKEATLRWWSGDTSRSSDPGRQWDFGMRFHRLYRFANFKSCYLTFWLPVSLDLVAGRSSPLRQWQVVAHLLLVGGTEIKIGWTTTEVWETEETWGRFVQGSSTHTWGCFFSLGEVAILSMNRSQHSQRNMKKQSICSKRAKPKDSP